MSNDQQLVISLNKLTLPTSSINRLTLSLLEGTSEHFIYNERSVRDRKVHLYQQKFFFSFKNQQVMLKIYQVSDAGELINVVNFRISVKELNSFRRRPAVFKSYCSGYELTWEGHFHNVDQSNLYPQSSRDYSELNSPFKFAKNRIAVRRHGLVRTYSPAKCKRQQKKRCYSALLVSTLKQTIMQPLRNEIVKPISNKDKENDRNYSNVARKRSLTSITSLQKKKKTLKSHLYTNLVTGIKGLILGSKQKQRKMPIYRLSQ